MIGSTSVTESWSSLVVWFRISSIEPEKRFWKSSDVTIMHVRVHFPNAPMGPKTSPTFRESVYAANGYKMEFLWEHDIKKARKLAFADSGVKDPSIYAKA